MECSGWRPERAARAAGPCPNGWRLSEEERLRLLWSCRLTLSALGSHPICTTWGSRTLSLTLLEELARLRKALACSAVGIAASWLAGPAGAAPSFVALGYLPDDYDSYAQSVSADGSVVVGESGRAQHFEGFRWTQGAMTGLGFLHESGNRGYALGVSGDGSVVVGGSGSSGSIAEEAFRWTKEEGLVGLGKLSSELGGSLAFAVSADGAVVVGGSSSELGPQAFRWTAAEGMVGLGDLAGGIFQSQAWAVSADGNVVVGYGATESRDEAFRWSMDMGMVSLGTFSGGSFSFARGVSADGAVVVGYGNSGQLGIEPFRWTEAEGLVALGPLPRPGWAQAYGVSGDGTIITGTAYTSPMGNGGYAFVWDSIHGVRDLQDILMVEYGLPLEGWTLLGANAISADGRAIVGWGTNPLGAQEAWLAIIPEPSTLLLFVSGFLIIGWRRRPGRPCG